MKKIFKLLINLALIQTGFCMTEQDVIDDLRREQEIEIYKKTDGDHLNNSLSEDEGKRDDRSSPPKKMLRSRSGGYGSSSSSSSSDSWSEY